MLSARPRHLANYLVVSLAPNSEGNLLASAAGAQLLPLHPASSWSTSPTGAGAETGAGARSEGISDVEFAAALEVLASSTPRRLLSDRFPTGAVRDALALRSTHTVVLLQPALPTDSTEGNGSGDGNNYETALVKRAEQLASLASMRTVTTGGFAQAVVSLEPLLDLAGEPVPSSSWADLAKQAPTPASVKPPATPTNDVAASATAAAAPASTATPDVFMTAPPPDKQTTASSASSRAKRKSTGDLEAPDPAARLSTTPSKAGAAGSGSGGGGAAAAADSASSAGADADALDSFYDVPADDDVASDNALSPVQSPSTAAVKKMRRQSKESPVPASSPTSNEQGSEMGHEGADGAQSSPRTHAAADATPQPPPLPAPPATSPAKSITDPRATRHKQQKPKNGTSRNSRSGDVGGESRQYGDLGASSAAGTGLADARVDRASAEAPPPPPREKRKAPVLVDGWLARSDENYRARGAGRLEGAQRGGDDDEGDDQGDAAAKGEVEEEEDESRYKPMEEAVSLVVVPESTQQAFASQARKRAAQHRSHSGSSGGGAPAATGGGVPNFKKFRKNHVLYGPAVGDFVELVEVSAEENERVAQMRREEGEAEEYERQADALFADNNGRSHDRGRRR